MFHRIGEYISLELFYFVNFTSSCSLMPYPLNCIVCRTVLLIEPSCLLNCPAYGPSCQSNWLIRRTVLPIELFNGQPNLACTSIWPIRVRASECHYVCFCIVADGRLADFHSVDLSRTTVRLTILLRLPSAHLKSSGRRAFFSQAPLLLLNNPPCYLRHSPSSTH